MNPIPLRGMKIEPYSMRNDPCGGGSNTSTVTLRVVGGDEKGSLKSETINTVASPKGLGPKKTELARASGTYKRQTRPLVREGPTESRT
jgi:hypothetical protein